MRLPNPLAAYRRWSWRRRCKAAGIDVAFAERLNEVGAKANAAGEEMAALITKLALLDYRGEALILEMRRQLGIPE